MSRALSFEVMTVPTTCVMQPTASPSIPITNRSAQTAGIGIGLCGLICAVVMNHAT